MTEETTTPPEGGAETLTLTKVELEKMIAEAVAPVKAKADELLSETKAERAKRKELETAQTEAERKRAEEQGEFQKLYQAEQEARRKVEADLDTYRQQVTKSTLEGEAGKIAAELARDTQRAALLSEQAAKFLKPTDDGMQYEIGGVQVDRAKVLDHLRSAYPFLVDGSQASGGGATGGNGGAGQRKPDEMSAQDRALLLNENPDEFYRLFPHAKLR